MYATTNIDFLLYIGISHPLKISRFFYDPEIINADHILRGEMYDQQSYFYFWGGF